MLAGSAAPLAGWFGLAPSAKPDLAPSNLISLAELGPGVVALLSLIADHVGRRPERMIAAVHGVTMTPVYIPACRADLPEYKQFVLLPDDMHERWAIAIKSGHLAVRPAR